jgi:F0F1-type ATP synthase assembly protein I
LYISEERKAKKQEEKRQTVRLLSMISQFGINMLVPIFLCFFVGRMIDRHFGTAYWTIIWFFVGAITGFRNVYIFAKRYFQNPPAKTPDLTEHTASGESGQEDIKH